LRETERLCLRERQIFDKEILQPVGDKEKKNLFSAGLIGNYFVLLSCAEGRRFFYLSPS
jgi:hypothetical protein